MPVQSCRLFVASAGRPRMLSLYMDDWKAVAHAPALLANSVNASPEVVFGLARFTSDANLKTPRGATFAWVCAKYRVSHFLGESSCCPVQIVASNDLAVGCRFAYLQSGCRFVVA